ncbi:T-cell surface antigen CD2-like [Arapaima gigas]
MVKTSICVLFILYHASFTDGEMITEVYAATGSTVYLHAPLTNSANDFLWKKGDTEISTFPHLGHVSLMPNGTLRLENALRNDTGTYTTEVFTRAGKLMFIKHYHLYILDPVSVPVVQYECCSHGFSQFKCFVDKGDDVVYQWSFHSVPATGQNTFSNNIPIWQHGSGTVTCTAKNHVSAQQSPLFNFTCTGGGPPEKDITRIGLLVVIFMILVCFAVAVMRLYFLHQHQRDPSNLKDNSVSNNSSISKTNEVIYSDIKTVKRS